MAESPAHDLIEAARAGDGAALEELLRRHQERIYRFSMKMCRNTEDAEDVLQETLLAVARKIGDFRGGSSLSTWLYTIARNFCIKKRRTSKFAPEREESLEGGAGREAYQIADGSRPPDEEVAGRELQTALSLAITALDAGYREVMLLRDVEGLTAPEVADVLDISVAAVKSRLHRARAAVRQGLLPLLHSQAAEEQPAKTCPDVIDLLSRKLEGEVSAELCTEMEHHLESCPNCRGACESLKRTLALCRTVPAPRVPRSVRDSVHRAIAELADS